MIKFNYFATTYDAKIDAVCTPTSIDYIYKSITNPDVDKKLLPYIQMYDNGKRVGKDNFNIEYWNNCVYVDIDSKYFFENDKTFLSLPQDKQQNAIRGFIAGVRIGLEEVCPYNYYAFNISKSKKGFKVIFYYDCEKTEENLKKAYKKSVEYILKVGHESHKQFLEILNYNKVIDKAAESKLQGFSVSGYGLFINPNINSELFGESDCLQDVGIIKETNNSNNFDIDIPQHNNIKFIKKIKVNNVCHLDHYERWRLWKALVVVFKDLEIVNKEYDYCIDIMAPGKKSKRFYKNEKKYNKFDEKKYNDLSILEKFGYVFKENTNYEKFIPNKIINLESHQFISDFKSEILKNMIYFRKNISGYDLLSDNSELYDNVYIKANCGTGKSVFFKKMLLSVQKCIIVVHLNSIKDGVYKEEIKRDLGLSELNIEIPSTREIKKLVSENKLPNQMILGWDQLKYLCKKSIDLSSYLKLFDEVHNVISTFNYRNKTIWPIIQNKDLQHNCIIVTATNCGEHNCFCSNSYKIQFIKKPKYTLTHYIINDSDTKSEEKKSVFNTVNDIIASNSINSKLKEENHKFVIFDNINHAKFARRWTSDLSVHFCKENKTKKDVEELLKTNNLSKPIFITTSYGLEGIEIKNKIKDLTVIIPLYDYNITSTDVEQLINRFRNLSGNVNVIFIPNFSIRTDSDYISEQKKIMNNLLATIKEMFKNTNQEDLIDREEYFLSKRLKWNYQEILSEIDPYIKILKIYHNHLWEHGLSSNNLYKFYPDLMTGKYKFITEEEKKDSITYKCVAQNIKEIIGIPQYDDCFNVLVNIENEENIYYEDIRKFVKIRNFTLRLLKDYGIEDPKEHFINNNLQQINDIKKSDQYSFIINLATHFIKNNKFNFSAFKRFIKARTIVKSTPLTTKDIETQNKEIKYYQNTIKKLGVHDKLVSNLFFETYKELKPKVYKKRDRKGKAIGKAIGKARHNKYTLKSDNSIEFYTHEECYNYLIEQKMIEFSIGVYIKKSKWKLFFDKVIY